MEEQLLKIINHYGIMPQLKHIHSEYFELDEAIMKYEHNNFNSIDFALEHVEEELADVMVMLEQFRLYYGIHSMQIIEIMKQKIERQLKRIEEEK